MPGRGRVEPVMCQRSLQWRIVGASLLAVRNFEDCVNAFLAIGREATGAAILEIVDREFKVLAQQQYAYGCVLVRCFGGEFVALPQQGVLAGDPFAATGFRNGFRHVYQQVDVATNGSLRKMMSIRSPMG